METEMETKNPLKRKWN